MNIGTPEWQHAVLDDYLYVQSAPREFLIRRQAADVVKQPETYTTGYWFPYRNRGRICWTENDALPPPGIVPYQDIHVRLEPHLSHYPQEAQLIAERIIAAQMRRWDI